METAVILLCVILALAVFAVGYLAYLCYFWKRLPDVISTVESTKGSGSQKMALAEYELSYRIPIIFRLFVTKKWVENEAQNAYESMRKFAEWRRENERKTRRKNDGKSVAVVAVEPLLEELVGMPISALVEKANGMGIDTSDYSDTKDLVHAILEKIAKS